MKSALHIAIVNGCLNVEGLLVEYEQEKNKLYVPFILNGDFKLSNVCYFSFIW